MANTVQIVFQPSGRRGEIEAGKSILEAAPVFELGSGRTVPCVRKECHKRERAI